VIVAWWIGITFTLSPHEYAGVLVVTTTTEILRFYHHLNVRGYNQVCCRTILAGVDVPSNRCSDGQSSTYLPALDRKENTGMESRRCCFAANRWLGKLPSVLCKGTGLLGHKAIFKIKGADLSVYLTEGSKEGGRFPYPDPL